MSGKLAPKWSTQPPAPEDNFARARAAVTRAETEVAAAQTKFAKAIADLEKAEPEANAGKKAEAK
jgi:hypothetical protein